LGGGYTTELRGRSAVVNFNPYVITVEALHFCDFVAESIVLQSINIYLLPIIVFKDLRLIETQQ